jgi:hypothetical protein
MPAFGVLWTLTTSWRLGGRLSSHEQPPTPAPTLPARRRARGPGRRFVILSFVCCGQGRRVGRRCRCPNPRGTRYNTGPNALPSSSTPRLDNKNFSARSAHLRDRLVSRPSPELRRFPLVVDDNKRPLDGRVVVGRC